MHSVGHTQVPRYLQVVNTSLILADTILGYLSDFNTLGTYLVLYSVYAYVIASSTIDDALAHDRKYCVVSLKFSNNRGVMQSNNHIIRR